VAQRFLALNWKRDLTSPMDQSPSKISSCSSDEGVQLILLKQEVPCHAHRSLYCILSQMNPIYIPIMIHFYIRLISALMSSKVSTPFRYSDGNVYELGLRVFRAFCMPYS
jgi:hypothetical protein